MGICADTGASNDIELVGSGLVYEVEAWVVGICEPHAAVWFIGFLELVVLQQ